MVKLFIMRIDKSLEAFLIAAKLMKMGMFYFRKGEEKFHYGGKYSKEGIIDWLEE